MKLVAKKLAVSFFDFISIEDGTQKTLCFCYIYAYRYIYNIIYIYIYIYIYTHIYAFNIYSAQIVASLYSYSAMLFAISNFHISRT